MKKKPEPTKEQEGETLESFSVPLPPRIIQKIKEDAKASPYDAKPAQVARTIIVNHYEALT